MVERVPGFTLQEQDEEEETRGLGQATGNVLINGERLASKSDTVEYQLRRISASDVIRIEVADGATLNIPGLSGQVVNVVARQSGFSGQFNWDFEPANQIKKSNFTKGGISASASLGRADVTLAFSNDSRRGASLGPALITDGDGMLIDARELFTHSRTEIPKFSGSVRYETAGGAVANLKGAYLWNRFDWHRREARFPTFEDPSVRFIERSDHFKEYEIGADLDFRVGPGRLKLIGLESSKRQDYSTQAIIELTEGVQDSGTRYVLDADSRERIGRGEYRWRMLGGDWSMSAEAAFNRLDNISGLFELGGDGEFLAIPFPEGTGGVTEDRYEAILSYGRTLTSRLSLQVAVGGEYSRLVQTGFNAEERSFRRPKGSFSLAWAPRPDLDISMRLNRRVGQLEFGDFLAEVFVDNDNANAGNNQLVPEQSWEAEIEIAKDFGAWGSARLNLKRIWIEDVVTFILLPGGGESLGNVDRADRKQLIFDGSLRLEPLGIPGARVDVLLELEDSSIIDPVTAELRPIDHTEGFNLETEFRHDIPRSDFAWGFIVRRTDLGRYYRIFELGEDDGFRKWGEVYVENKDVFGLTLRATYANAFSETSRTYRTFYDGPHDLSPVLYGEKSDRKLYPQFSFEVKGSF